MKKAMLLLLAVAVVLGFSGVVAYAQDKPAANPGPKTGPVKSIDLEGKKMVVTAGRDLTFTLTDATKVVQGDKAMTLADIKVGAKVTVEYTKAGDTRTATKITILVEEKKAK